jgi:hypothetical protein
LLFKSGIRVQILSPNNLLSRLWYNLISYLYLRKNRNLLKWIKDF